MESYDIIHHVIVILYFYILTRKKKRRKNMKETRKMVRQIVGFYLIMILFCAFIGNSLGAVSSLKRNKTSVTEIMSYKERAYQIYNEGLEASENWLYPGYDRIAISSPSAEDRELAYHQGVKYVRHPDLLEFEVSDSWNTIKYDGTIKFYGWISKNYYIEILVDWEHIDDINYYDYREVKDITGIVKTAISMSAKEAIGFIAPGIIASIIIAVIAIFIIWAIENWHQKKDNYKEEKNAKDEDDNDNGNEERQKEEDD